MKIIINDHSRSVELILHKIGCSQNVCVLYASDYENSYQHGLSEQNLISLC